MLSFLAKLLKGELKMQDRFIRGLKVSFALLVVMVIIGTSVAFAAAPTTPFQLGTGGTFPKPVYDWYVKNVFNKFTGIIGGFMNADAPFDTPAFYPPHAPFFAGQGTLQSTTYDECIAFIKSLPKNYMRWDYVGNITTYDRSGSAGAYVYLPLVNFGYPVIVFSKGPNGPVFDPEELRALGKPIYFIEGPIHGNEMSGGEATISTIKRLAYDEYNVLDKISVVIVPRLNIDGAYWNIRGSYIIRGQGWGMDQNRDGTMLHSPQSRLINMITNAYKPHLGIDIHEMSWSAPTGSPVYYPSGVYGEGSTVSIGAVTVPNNTIDGSGTTTINRHFTYQGWSPIDLGSKYHNTPKAISDWQDKLLEYIKNYFAQQNMFSHEYILGTQNTMARKPDGVEVVSGDQIVKYPGNVQQYFRFADCIPDEGYGDGALGLKQMIEFCAEVPSSSGAEYKLRVYFHFVAQQAQMKFLAEHAQEILKDVEDSRNWMHNDTSDVALWNWQTHEPRRHKVFKVIDGKIADAETGDHYYEYTVPMHFHNKERKAGKTVTRPFAYIIDPEHVANNEKIRDDLAAFRLSYTGIPVYRLSEPATVSVEGSTVRGIQGHGIGNSFSTGNAPTLSVFDDQGNYTGTLPSVTVSGDTEAAYINTTYLGGYDTAGSSFGIQTQRIWQADTNVETKTFPVGSFVIPVSGVLTNHANLHAILALEALGKRNLGNSYTRFTPGLHSAAINSDDLAQEWPYPYRAHYFPVEVGKKFPAYRYMNNDYTTALKLERVYTVQPFVNGANFAAGYPVNLSILKDKGINTGAINNIGLGYHFKAEGTTLTAGLNPKAGNFYVTAPTKFDGASLGNWFIYDWGKNQFDKVNLGVSETSGAKIVNVSSQYISDESDVLIIAEATKNWILELFKDGKLPKDAILTENGFEYTEMLSGKTTILSDSMLDGWTIISMTPHSGNHWKAGFVKGVLEIKFTGDAYDQVVTVTLKKTGTSETKDIEITFSGEKESIWDRFRDKAGCNTGMAVFALLALSPLFMRKKD